MSVLLQYTGFLSGYVLIEGAIMVSAALLQKLDKQFLVRAHHFPAAQFKIQENFPISRSGNINVTLQIDIHLLNAIRNSFSK